MIAPTELKPLNERFNRQPTQEILRWAWDRFGTRAAIGTSFQGAGLVMMHLAKQNNLPFPVFTLDTGLLFKETLELKTRLEDFYGSKIEPLEPDARGFAERAHAGANARPFHLSDGEVKAGGTVSGDAGFYRAAPRRG